MSSEFSRRAVLAGLSATTVTAALPTSAFALNGEEAKALIDKAVADINRVIKSGKPLSAMIRDFERIFAKYGDVPIIARSALGADARRISKSQLAAYTKAFQGYMARKYGKRFNEFVGGQIDVQNSRKVKSFYEVTTTVKLRGEAPFEVNFLVSDRSGRDRFFDMIIEGISVRLSEKAEIGAMLDRRKGDINALIADLNKAG